MFGVDINPNSCEIARLRLWIELLKSAYFTDFTIQDPTKQNALETLPNIDINIKCGNSLLSYFKLDTKLTEMVNIADNQKDEKIKANIQGYKQLVNNYKKGLNNKKQLAEKMKKLQES